MPPNTTNSGIALFSTLKFVTSNYRYVFAGSEYQL